MNENLNNPAKEELQRWIKEQLDTAVRTLMDKGVLDGLIVEAKPAWVLPFQILIGKIRVQDQAASFDWFICGEMPTDILGASVAPSPREAARHFAMKWQLDAARQQLKLEQNPITFMQEAQQQEPGNTLADQAEALYALVEDNRLWMQADSQ